MSVEIFVTVMFLTVISVIITPAIMILIELIKEEREVKRRKRSQYHKKLKVSS